jgi:alpha-tubulin suppressor-like RCC1 family protein
MRNILVGVALVLCACGGTPPSNPDGGGGGGGSNGCPAGYTGSAGMCTDIDECATTKPCAQVATCTNTPGSFTCACPAGFAGDGRACVKLNAEIESEGFCIINSQRQMWCWGSTYGFGSHAPYIANVPVQVSPDNDWEEVSFQGGAACAVKTDGTLWCIGFADEDNLGLGAPQKFVALADWTRIGADSDWAHVVLDRENGCAIKKDGSLWCWGHDDRGGTGQGKPAMDTLTETPTKVGTATNWKQLSLHYATACAIDATGALFCFGANYNGQAGVDSATMAVTAPTRLGTDSDWAQVSTGGTTCAIKTNGTLWCWGIVGTMASPTPAQQGTDTDWAQVSVADSYACARKKNGAAWCWGYNTNGQLGNGSQMKAPTLGQVSGGGTFITLAAGANTVCGIAQASDGTLSRSCWGDNSDGQLGDGTGGELLEVRQIGSDKWDSVAAGGYVSCAIKSTEHGLYCWGNEPLSGLPTQTPLRIGTDGDWTEVSVSDVGTVCGVRGGNAVYCWGQNENGECGVVSTTNPVTAPTQVTVSGKTFASVHTIAETTCALDTASELYCWGSNRLSSLGSGSTTPMATSTPTLVAGGISWQSAFTGGDEGYTCGITAGGQMYCFGDNSSGQCLVGGMQSYDAPLLVSSTVTFTSAYGLSARSTCAVGQTNGGVYCWGENFNSGIQSNPRYPSTDFGGALSEISGGGYDSFCGVQNGAMWCWGQNEELEIPSGLRGQAVQTPALVTPYSDWVHVSLARGRGMAIRADGSLWCWGSDRNGGCGTGNAFALTPVTTKM